MTFILTIVIVWFLDTTRFSLFCITWLYTGSHPVAPFQPLLLRLWDKRLCVRLLTVFPDRLSTLIQPEFPSTVILVSWVVVVPLPFQVPIIVSLPVITWRLIPFVEVPVIILSLSVIIALTTFQSISIISRNVSSSGHRSPRGSMCRTCAACRLHSHWSMVCDQEWHNMHWVRLVHSNVEWSESRHVVHYTAYWNHRSSSQGSARCRAPHSHVITVLGPIHFHHPSMTWSMVLVRKSSTASIVRSGSRSAAKKLLLPRPPEVPCKLIMQCLKSDAKL